MGKNRQRAGPRCSGFTFVEMIVAMAVLATGALIAFPTMLSFFDLSRTARDENIATHDLSSAAEDLIATPFSQIVVSYPDGQPIPKFTDLHLNEQRVLVSYDDVAADPLVITLSATWSDHRGRDRREVFRCLRTK